MCLPCKHEEKPDFRSPEPCKCQVGVVAWESRDGISRTSWLALVSRSVFDWGPTTKNKTATDWGWFLTSATYACKHKCKNMHAHTKKERGGDGKVWRCWVSSKNGMTQQVKHLSQTWWPDFSPGFQVKMEGATPQSRPPTTLYMVHTWTHHTHGNKISKI